MHVIGCCDKKPDSVFLRGRFLLHGSPLASMVRSSYFPLQARRIWRGAGLAASGPGLSAESTLPHSTANFRASPNIGGFSLGLAELIRTVLRVLRLVGLGTFFTCCKCFGSRFQPFRVQCQPSFLKPLPFMRLQKRLPSWFR